MANQSVLELAVGTGKWDAGLKKAKQSLENFTQANGGLQKALEKESQKMQQFVQMMGKMDSTAKTAKGQMNDYKSTIEQLTMQYNRMTDAQKQTIGQDYLKAIEQIKQKYHAVNEEIQEMNRSLSGASSSGSSGGGLFDGISSKFDGMIQVFGGNMMTKAFDMASGAAFNFVNTIKEAAAQGIEMAKSGEGIRLAFDRLNRPEILENLRQATHNTVTDIELMKAAVKFNDFKLPLSELGTMLAFAQQKAKDTGQSIDYMVDSIVTGLGRKSLMILDNLGLSADQIKTKMKETGDMTSAVGEIIREQMKSAGDYVETAADRATRADVELKNAMEQLGQSLMPLQEQGVEVFNSIELAAIKFLNEGVNQLVPALQKMKSVIDEVYDASVTNNWLTQGFIEWLETGIDVSFRFIPYLKDIKYWIDAIKNSGNAGAGAAVGGALSKVVMQGSAINEIPEIYVTGNKPKKSGTKKNLPEYRDFTTQVFKNSGSDLKGSFEHVGVFDMFKSESQFDPENILGSQDAWKEYKDTITGAVGSIGESFENLTTFTKDFDPLKPLTKAAKQNQAAMSLAAQAASSFSSALAGMEDPGAKAAGTVIGAIANIALGFAYAASAKDTTASGWAWLAWVAAGMAALATTISTVHSLTGYAQGGIVEGNSYSGDNMMFGGDGLYGLNAGELVLTKAQQNSLAQTLSGNGLGNINVTGRLNGTDILLSADRAAQASGRGQLVTWK